MKGDISDTGVCPPALWLENERADCRLRVFLHRIEGRCTEMFLRELLFGGVMERAIDPFCSRLSSAAAKPAALFRPPRRRSLPVMSARCGDGRSREKRCKPYRAAFLKKVVAKASTL